MKHRVLYAVLNWGLGHASRSVPVIESILQHNADVFLVSNGRALEFLKNRFPQLASFEIPDKEIKYHRLGAAVGLLKRTFQQKRINEKQKEWIAEKVRKLAISHIVSDNIYGAFHHAVPSVIITHQVGILSPFFKSRFDQQIAAWLQKFDSVWVPDLSGKNSVSGKMLENKYFKGNLDFIGHISRFHSSELALKDIDVLAVLSGPEPQRTFLEKILIDKLSTTKGKHIIIRGKMDSKPSQKIGNTAIQSFMGDDELSSHIRRAKLVICRSGYSSILDMLRLSAKACLIPTPQQPEQKYLAKRMTELGWFNSVTQNNLGHFDLEQLPDNLPRQSLDFGEKLSNAVATFLNSRKAG